MKFSTKAIHMGSEPDKETGAIMPPIYMSSTFALEAPGVDKGFEYTRAHNPNFVASKSCSPPWRTRNTPPCSPPASAP